MRAFAITIILLLLGAAAYAAETITYTYDARGRLVQVNHSGTVNNNVERMLARSLAMTFGAFSITNNLKTDAEVQAMLEHVN